MSALAELVFDGPLCGNTRDIVVFAYFLFYADSCGNVNHGYRLISKRTGLPVDEVRASIARLEDGFISPVRLNDDVHPDDRSEGWTVTAMPSGRPRQQSEQVSLPVLGFVYYAVAGQLVKIGWSVNPWKRVASMKTAAPGITLYAMEGGARDLERKRHGQFSALRTDGEWFSLQEPLSSHVEAVRQAAP